MNVNSYRRLSVVGADDYMATDREGDERVGMAEVDVGDHGKVVKPWVAADYFFNHATGHAAGTLEAADHQTIDGTEFLQLRE